MRVLLVEDDPDWQERLGYLLRAYGHEVVIAATWRAAFDALESGDYGKVVLDLHLGYNRDDGFLLLELMQIKGLHVPTLVVSYSADLQGVSSRAFQYGCVREIICKSKFVEFTIRFQRFIQDEAKIMKNYSRVFVIHGRDDTAKNRILKILHALRTIPVYLEREATGGKTIIELLEKFTDVPYCVAVMSADDVGHYKDEPHAAKSRARQNVILEIGYIMGKLERERILILKDDVELPSDLAGIRCVSLSSTDEVIKTALVRDFQDRGDIHFEY